MREKPTLTEIINAAVDVVRETGLTNRPFAIVGLLAGGADVHGKTEVEAERDGDKLIVRFPDEEPTSFSIRSLQRFGFINPDDEGDDPRFRTVIELHMPTGPIILAPVL